MTIQEIIDAICEAIYAAFGSTHKIYTEQVEQDLEAPCFFVKCLDPAMSLVADRMYKRTHQFSIQFFPATPGSYNERQTAFEKLFDALEDITVAQTSGTTTVNRILHGRDAHAENSDEVMTFLVEYDIFLLREYSEVTMADMDMTVDVE